MRTSRAGRAVVCGLIVAGVLGGWAILSAEGAAPVRKPITPRNDPRAKTAVPDGRGGVVEEFKASGDPTANMASLQKEKLETLQQREEFLRTAAQAGKAKASQLDNINLDLLHIQLDLLDKPALRIETHEKIITILKKLETQSEQDLMKAQRGNDADAIVSSHGRATSARIRRINAQMGLERERASLEKEMEAAKN